MPRISAEGEWYHFIIFCNAISGLEMTMLGITIEISDIKGHVSTVFQKVTVPYKYHYIHAVL